MPLFQVDYMNVERQEQRGTTPQEKVENEKKNKTDLDHFWN